jgi:GNAT superfamily N-acetyltransferase
VSVSIDIRRIAAADLDEVVRLRSGMTGWEQQRALCGPAYYRWKYLETGQAHAVGAFGGDRLLGLLAGTPRMIRSGDRAIRAVEIGEIFVDPDVRGRGIFRALHDDFLSTLARRDIEALCCLPAPEAEEVFRGCFRYQKALTIAIGEYHVNSERMPRGRPGIEVVYETIAGPDYDGLDTDLGAGTTATVRSADRITRRYLQNPTPYTLVALRRGQRLEGWLVLLALDVEGRDPDGYLVDALVWPEPAVQHSAVAAAARWFEEKGCKRVINWHAAGTQDPPILPDPRPINRQRRLDYLILPVNAAGRSLLRQSARAQWVFRIGDTDGLP